MKILLTLTTVIWSCFSLQAQEQDLYKVLNEQVEAYNAADIDRLVKNITDDFKWFYVTSDSIILEVSGKEELRKAMEGYYSAGFNSVSSIEDYTIDGNRISFKEVVGHRNKKGEMVQSSSMGVYEMRNGKIYRAWYFMD